MKRRSRSEGVTVQFVDNGARIIEEHCTRFGTTPTAAVNRALLLLEFWTTQLGADEQLAIYRASDDRTRVCAIDWNDDEVAS